MAIVRCAWAADLPAALSCLKHLSDLGTVSVPDTAAAFRDMIRCGTRIFVALVDGQIVGTASLALDHKLIHSCGTVGRIEDVAVLPEHQGKGIGSALVGHLIDQARQAGCYKVILYCDDDLEPFYGRFGFKRHGIAMRVDLL